MWSATAGWAPLSVSWTAATPARDSTAAYARSGQATCSSSGRSTASVAPSPTWRIHAAIRRRLAPAQINSTARHTAADSGNVGVAAGFQSGLNRTLAGIRARSLSASLASMS